MGFRRRRYRHFGPPSNPPRQRAGLLRPLCGLSEACLLSSYGLPKATLGILDRLQTLLGRWQCKACLLSSYGLPKAMLGILDRLQRLLGSWQACCGLSVACPKPASSLLMGFRRRREAFWTAFKPSSAPGRPVAASLWPVRSLPPLFLWASEGDVRHFGPPSKPPRQLAGLLRPLCGLSEACPSLLMGFRRRRSAFWTAFKRSSAPGRPAAASLFRRVVLALRNSPAVCRALFS